MIGAVIGIILVIIFLGVIWWAFNQLLPLIQPYVAEPFYTILRVMLVILLVVIVLWVIIKLLALAGIVVPFLR